MTRIVWITDPHLNHVAIQAWDFFIDSIDSLKPDSLLITGDISEGDDVVFQLNRLSESIRVPIRFVLGNHDFYQSSFAQTRRSVIDAERNNPMLEYLTDGQPIELSDEIVLVGEDGWGDATAGDYDNSPIRLNDFVKIEDFYLHHPERWKMLLHEQGAFAATRLHNKLRTISESAKHIIVATHVPPFSEACWYEGKTTDENWAPFFVCGQLGDELRDFAKRNLNRQITVLCGHTHHNGIAQISDNLIVHTGAAIYGSPDVWATIEIDSSTVMIQAKS